MPSEDMKSINDRTMERGAFIMDVSQGDNTLVVYAITTRLMM